MNFPKLISKKLFKLQLLALYFLLIFFLSNLPISRAQEVPQSTPKLSPVTLQLKWFHQFQFAGYYAALHKGFFEAEGLDVTIKAGGPDVKVDEEVSSGRSDYGVLASELIEKKAQGQPLVLIAAFMQHSTRAIIVRADSGINAPADLVAKLLMINRNEDIEFMAMFSSEGIPLDRLNIIAKDKSANGKFIKGEIEGLNGSIGNQPFLFSQKGIPVKMIRPISYGIDFYGDSLFTSEIELSKHPARVEAFRRATIKGWQYAMSNTSEIIDLILTKYNSNKTRAALQFEADAIRTLMLPDLVEIGHVNPQRLERIAHIYSEKGLVPKNFSLKGFVYDPLRAEIERKEHFRKIFLAAGAIFVVVFAILILFVFSLRRLVKMKTEEVNVQKMLLDKSQEIANLGSWHLDIKNNVLLWSAEECRIFDKDSSEAKQTYESFLDAVHPDDREMVDKTYTEAITNKQVYECIHRVIKKDGTIRIVREKSEDIVDQSGETIHSFGFTQDITEQQIRDKEREEIIQQLEQSLNEIKVLRGILPICSVCKNIRNDEGYYEQIESYLHKHSGVDFSHTICPNCMKEHFPEEYESIINKKKSNS